MRRIERDRIGYSGYSCAGISPYVVDAIDCFSDRYQRLPPKMNGAVSNFDFEDLSPISLSIQTAGSRLRTCLTNCPTDFDPFHGTMIDLLKAFEDEGVLGFLDLTACYTSPSSRYTEGFVNPVPSVTTYGGGDGGPCQESCSGAEMVPSILNYCSVKWTVSCPCSSSGPNCSMPVVADKLCGYDSGKSYDTWVRESNPENWSYWKLNIRDTCTSSAGCPDGSPPADLPDAKCCRLGIVATYDEASGTWNKICTDAGCSEAGPTDWSDLTSTNPCTTERYVLGDACADSGDCTCASFTPGSVPDPAYACKKCYTKFTSSWDCASNSSWSSPSAAEMVCSSSAPSPSSWTITSSSSTGCEAAIWVKNGDALCDTDGDCSSANAPGGPSLGCHCTGACCEGSTCNVKTESECSAAGGVFQGIDTTCDPDPCGSGACCEGSTCSIKTESECDSAGGVYRGGGTDCDPDPCGSGACCEGSTCSIKTESECSAAGGVYRGGGTDCDPNPCASTGACCVGYDCTIETETDCSSMDGVYKGNGTTCDPNPCLPIGGSGCPDGCFELYCLYYSNTSFREAYNAGMTGCESRLEDYCSSWYGRPPCGCYLYEVTKMHSWWYVWIKYCCAGERPQR